MELKRGIFGIILGFISFIYAMQNPFPQKFRSGLLAGLIKPSSEESFKTGLLTTPAHHSLNTIILLSQSGKEIEVAHEILKESPYLEAMLTQSFKEKRENKIQFPETSTEELEALIMLLTKQYHYKQEQNISEATLITKLTTDIAQLSNISNVLLNIIALSDQWQTNFITQALINYLINNSDENIIETIKTSPPELQALILEKAPLTLQNIKNLILLLSEVVTPKPEDPSELSESQQDSISKKYGSFLIQNFPSITFDKTLKKALQKESLKSNLLKFIHNNQTGDLLRDPFIAEKVWSIFLKNNMIFILPYQDEKMITIEDNGKISLWDLTNKKEIINWQSPTPILKAEVNPLYNELITLNGTSLSKWDLATGALLINKNSQQSYLLAVHPEGKNIVTASSTTIYIWNNQLELISSFPYQKIGATELADLKLKDNRIIGAFQFTDHWLQVFYSQNLNSNAISLTYIIIWDISGNEIMKFNQNFNQETINLNPYIRYGIHLIPDQEKILINGNKIRAYLKGFFDYKSQVYEINLITGEIKEFFNSQGIINAIKKISNQYYLFLNNDAAISVINLNTKQLSPLTTIDNKQLTSAIKSVILNRFIITGSRTAINIFLLKNIHFKKLENLLLNI
jgi:hypothetical protein